MELSSKGTKMATFERVNFLRASLSPEEVHLYSLYSITAYTGAIVGPPAPGEFAEVIRDRGVRIVTYISKAS